MLAPGHPLHDAVTSLIGQHLRGALDRGTVLASKVVSVPTLLVGLVEEVVDGTGATVSRRFGYAYADAQGHVRDAGPAPHLDCSTSVPAPVMERARALSWLQTAESGATRWIIEHQLQDFLAQTASRVAPDLERTRARVLARLGSEARRLRDEAAAAKGRERAGIRPPESSDSLRRKAEDLDERLVKRVALLDAQSQLSIKPPQLVSAALVLPLR